MQTPTLRLRTSSPAETRALGASIAQLLRPGDVVALSGELGAGKTCLVQGAAEGLGIDERVTSPTFVLVRLYDHGRLPVVHCDVYRLDRLQDVYDLGDEVLAPDVVTFVEWADAVVALLPDDRLEVDLQLADVEPARTIRRNGGRDDEVAPLARRRALEDRGPDPADSTAHPARDAAAGAAAGAGDGAGVGQDSHDAAGPDLAEGDRIIVVTARGAWRERSAQVVDACARWREGPARC